MDLSPGLSEFLYSQYRWCNNVVTLCLLSMMITDTDYVILKYVICIISKTHSILFENTKNFSDTFLTHAIHIVCKLCISTMGYCLLAIFKENALFDIAQSQYLG